MKFKERIARFMYGRYGADQLSNFILWTYIALFIINLFLNSLIIYTAATALMVWSFFRMFSRNIYARNKENLKFLSIKGKIASFFKLTFDRIRDVRSKAYKRCPHCKAIVRLPRKGGAHSVTCPKCRSRFRVKILPLWAVILISVGAFITLATEIALSLLLLLQK